MGETPLVDMPRNTSLADTRLVRRSQQGDRRAFRALLTRYDWRLRGLAHALLLDTGRVDAVLSVAYVKAWREVVRIDPREDAAAWLYRVVYNACIDGLRRESTRIGAAPPAAADVPNAVDEAADPPVQPMPAGGNGASPATTDGHGARVVEALGALAPADRVAVVLVDREGFAAESAARILGLTPEVVEARLAAARARLARQLADLAAVAPAEEAKPPREDAEPQPEEPGVPEELESQPEAPEELESQPEAPEELESQPEAPEELESQPEAPEELESQPEAQTEDPEETAEEPDIKLDDTTSADPADTKVASRSIAGGSSNGASGGGNTNGSDDGGGSGP
jgi:RNA polymerase sigma-70 factor, ECF subfamily